MEAQEEGADDPRAGADIGKTMNLMSSDADKYFPLQITWVECLRWIFRLVIGSPLSKILSSLTVRVHKGVMAFRDKCMGVVNELIGAVKFVKFFAWEDHWIQRTFDARESEVKCEAVHIALLNSIMFYSFWTCAPILISIDSFFTYVTQGNNLTISTAFTAILLFNMVQYVGFLSKPVNAVHL
ncbi:hypothetical protein P691DRAFT_823554 [Macrolepiota fuliginosa MF-IS2]|uniref:ABC transmembrane type-1 domain-containing protein n=1 Tax=Macrolepiota fuliginosa MF-IS2 TaxID=1400762 RepID=A0A9P5WYS4_9AGAR|nr:hypothetical protein P691DRAFT_823554 [Macrolepiota fuliginosa MF-IS2]